MSRPRIAVILSTWYRDSHADVFARKLIQGYQWGQEHIDARVQVVSAYIEQHGLRGPRGGDPDVGLPILAEHGIPLYDTPAEALGCGRPGVHVDGVLIVGEHGAYERNEYGQKLYPRRRLFDAVLSAMISAGRFVPVVNDKHLAWNFTDAKAMYDQSRRLGVPLLAGSTVPLTWRVPTGTAWPHHAEMTELVGAGKRGFETLGFHLLEGMQSWAERRRGGESGAAEVRGYQGADARRAAAGINPELLRLAIEAQPLADGDGVESVIDTISAVITITHRDGLQSMMVQSPRLRGFSVAAAGPEHQLAAEHRLHPGPPHSHFTFFARAAEHLFLHRTPPYPVERTLFTGGVLDHGIRNSCGAIGPQAPELDFGYQPPEDFLDTGGSLPLYVTAPLHHL